MSAALAVLGAAALFVLKVIGILLLIIFALVLLLLIIPFCADISWQGGQLLIKAGALGLTFPVFRYPKPAAPPKRAGRKAKKPKPKKEKKPASPRKKAKLTLDMICTILRGAGRLMRAVFGALRVTKINVRLGVRGADPAEAARNYGKLNAWLYPVLALIDRFVYLDFERLDIAPDFGSDTPAVEDSVSLRVSARALFIVIAAVRVLYEFWRKKVLDVLL